MRADIESEQSIEDATAHLEAEDQPSAKRRRRAKAAADAASASASFVSMAELSGAAGLRYVEYQVEDEGARLEVAAGTRRTREGGDAAQGPEAPPTDVTLSPPQTRPRRARGGAPTSAQRAPMYSRRRHLEE
jgi:hypothetical protein